MMCTRCDGSGFLNTHQIKDISGKEESIRILRIGTNAILAWIAAQTGPHDIKVCDCCGNGTVWYRVPGQHNSNDMGKHGPYKYNGGLPECY